MELTFNSSKPLTVGVEVELQIINPHSGDLEARAQELLRESRHFQKHNIYSWKITPEITQSMIEINSGIHETVAALLDELNQARAWLIAKAGDLDVRFAGGGTHPFQKWSDREIFPTPRFKDLSEQYGYLAKRFTVFGQHIHIGCATAEDALYLTHALSRFIPHFIALSASSPFYQGVDSTFDSARVNIVNTFPLSGVMPCFTTWEELSAYLQKMFDLQVIKSLKDFYWDIRPKPHFGTVEIRVCDTPLAMKKVAELTAYAQTLASYLLQERPITITPELYTFYAYNRFQASRYGFRGSIIDSTSLERHTINEDILMTLETLTPYAIPLQNNLFILQLKKDTRARLNDAKRLRRFLAKNKSFQALVAQQTELF